jgi:hypothetical protein
VQELPYEEWLLEVDATLRYICEGCQGILNVQEEIEVIDRLKNYKLPDWRAEYEKGTDAGELAIKIAKETELEDM